MHHHHQPHHHGHHGHHRRNHSNIDIEQIYQLYDFPFEAIFDVSEAKEEFRQYLKKEHNEEPFLFYEDVEEYKRLKFEENKAKKAIAIFKNYILPYSPHEINISSQFRQNAVKAFEQSGQLQNEKAVLIQDNIFDEIQSSIFYNLKNDNYPRFTTSQQFKNFLKHKDISFISMIATKKNNKYMDFIPKFDGPICDRDIQFFSFMSFNDDLDVWDEVKVGDDGRRACYLSKKEFCLNDQLECEEKMTGKLMKQIFIVPCKKEEAFNVFAHTHLRKEILDVESINQVDFNPISPNNKYAQSILHIQMQMKGFSWIMKPRETVAALTTIYDTKRQTYGVMLKSTESLLVPNRKSHIRFKILSSTFMQDCPLNAQITKQKELKRKSISSLKNNPSSSSSSISSLDGQNAASSSGSFSNNYGDSRRQSSVTEEDDSSESSESFGSAEHACKVTVVSFVELKVQSAFVIKKILNSKNKHGYARFLAAVKDSKVRAFPRPKFSEGLMETFESFKDHYLANNPEAEMTWELINDDELHDMVTTPEKNKTVF
ncbi:hypothetical protein C9374_007701 [Naegleria lovaniensis]|uniref:RGS domain-containing protein n=1 Tax=Naegleria lovaniensis TaxID=51637 RepID=A0AA88KIN1_NAELO|nr:uncharacterized protein C9374_007701 [Naegleria lovaniensis]KAG2379063.1 hypothetical protein C9374_007701 [Naegleria lovaniensis]